MNAASHRGKAHGAVIAACVLAAGIACTVFADAQTPRNIICNLTSKPNEELIRSCNELIRSRRDIGRPLADSYIARGRAYIATNQYDLAVADFVEAVRNAPSYLLALRSRANAYLLKADYDRAIKDYTDAIWIAPQDAALFHERGRAYEGKGDYTLAVRDYTEVNRIAPKFIAAYRDRCYVRMIAGRELPQALGDCNDALKLAPTDRLALERRGLVYLRLALFDKAIADFDAVLKVNALHPTALYGRGLAKRKKYDESAEADISAAQQLRPDIVELYTRYGIK